MTPTVYRDPAALAATVAHLRRILDTKDRRVLELETRLQRRADLDIWEQRALEWEDWDDLHQRLMGNIAARQAEIAARDAEIARLQQQARLNARTIDTQREEIARLRQVALAEATA
jgi:hypothetical protein